MTKKNYFNANQKPNPRIYAYRDDRWPGMLKVGFTKKTIKARMKEHYPTLTPTDTWEVLVNESALDIHGKCFTDHQVHRELQKMGFPRVEIEATGKSNGEWFECSAQDVREAICHVQCGISAPAQGRFQNFSMRNEQNEAVEAASRYFKTHPKNGSMLAPQFLWNCKMRFGKTFTAYQLMKKEHWQRMLVLTYKPSVRSAWRNDLNEHIDFDGYQFVSASNEDIQFEHADKKKPIVWFASFQDFLGNDGNGNFKPRNKAAADIEWDCIVIDESHFGAGTISAQNLTGETAELLEYEHVKQTEESQEETLSQKEVLAIDHLKAKNRLFLSGTPFKALRKGQFDDSAIYSWDYSKEQKAKAEWNDSNRKNPYSVLPQLRLFLYEIPGYINKNFLQNSERTEFSLNEFFRAEQNGGTETARFVHEQDVQKWLDMLRNGGEWEKRQQNFQNDENVPIMPYSGIAEKSLQHTVWYFQSVASCFAMKNLLQEQNCFWSKFHVICCAGTEAGTGEAALEPVLREIRRDNSATITLSCGKLLTGTTIPEWSGIFMLNDTKSPEAYFQSAFRVQSPYFIKYSDGSLPDEDMILKKDCYVFDFSPTRSLDLVREYAEGLIGQAESSESSSDIEESIRNFTKYLPIISCDESGMRQMDPNDILSKIYCGESSPAFVRKVRHIAVNMESDFWEEWNRNAELREAMKGIDPDIPGEIDSKKDEASPIKEGDGNTNTAPKKERFSQENPEPKEKLKNQIRNLCSKIPLFMYLTDKRERDISDCLATEKGLFESVVGLRPELFEKLLLALDKSDLIRIIYSFKRLEDSSFGYYGYNKHLELEEGIAKELSLDI